MSGRRLAVLGLVGGAAVLILVLLAGTALGWWNVAPAGGPAPSSPLAFARRNTSPHTAGSRNSVSAVDVIRPPITTVASGL